MINLIFFLVASNANFNISSDSVFLGENILITISNIYSRDTKYILSEDSSSWFPLILTEPIKVELITSGEESLLVNFNIEGAFFTEIDSATIHPPPIKVIMKDTIWFDSIAEIKLTINSSLLDNQDPIPVRPRLDIPPKPPIPLYKKILNFIFKYRYILLTLLILSYIASIIVYFIKRKKKKSISLNPREIALILIKSLEKDFMKDDKNLGKNFYDSLSDIFKQYIESMTTYPAKKMTIFEISNSVLNSIKINKKINRSLKAFNNTSELAKFAQKYFPSDIAEKDIKAVINFINSYPSEDLTTFLEKH